MCPDLSLSGLIQRDIAILLLPYLYLRRDYHQSFAQPDVRAENQGPLWRCSADSPVFKAEKVSKKTRAKVLPKYRAMPS